MTEATLPRSAADAAAPPGATIHGEDFFIDSEGAHDVYYVELQRRNWFRRAYDRIASATKGAWGWLKRTLRLGGLTTRVRRAGNWVMDKLAWVADKLGWTGILGAAGLMVTTDGGRSILDHTLGAALRLMGRIGHTIYGWVINLMHHLGRPGRWMADRMEDFASWSAKQTHRGAAWYAKNIAKHLDVNSSAMRLGRWASVIALGIRLAQIVPWPPVRYAAIGLTILWALMDGYSVAADFAEKRGWIKHTDRRRAAKMARDAAAGATGAAPQGRTNARKGANAGNTGGNRASRRTAPAGA